MLSNFNYFQFFSYFQLWSIQNISAGGPFSQEIIISSSNYIPTLNIIPYGMCFHLSYILLNSWITPQMIWELYKGHFQWKGFVWNNKVCQSSFIWEIRLILKVITQLAPSDLESKAWKVISTCDAGCGRKARPWSGVDGLRVWRTGGGTRSCARQLRDSGQVSSPP